MITIDGQHGEGGGQILRGALALAAATGRGFRIDRIRAGRAKPGLMRQHLTAVAAARAICDAEVHGAELGSTALEFHPQAVRAGDHAFDIGSAGSASLVLQAIVPALARSRRRRRSRSRAAPTTRSRRRSISCARPSPRSSRRSAGRST